MASRLYDEAGIPTARASQAFVTLAGRDLGLYVLKGVQQKLFASSLSGSLRQSL